MRNSKAKGFTLIELIIVIAIIGILAAILIPAMLGYLRNSRISRANANAKTAHTAAATALADASTVIGADPSAASGTIEIPDALSESGESESWGTYQFNWFDYLGESWAGYATVLIDPVNFAAITCTWSETSSGMVDPSKEKAPTAQQQKEAAKTATAIVGWYPLNNNAT